MKTAGGAFELLTFLRPSNFNAHHEILARTIAVPPASTLSLPNTAPRLKRFSV
jgi:hypothetical protein